MLKKRVLVTSIFPLFFPFFGVRFFTLAKNLIDEFDFTFLIRGPLPERNRWLDDCNIVDVPANVLIVDYIGWKELIGKTIRLAKEHDILFPQKPFSITGVLCYFLSKLMKKGFVQDADDYESIAVKWYYFQEKLSEMFLRKMARHVSVASTTLLKKYWTQGVFIPNCLDLEIFNPYNYDRNSIRQKVLTRWGVSQDEAMFVWASYFSGQEDSSYMPLVFGHLRKKELKFRVMLLGGLPKGNNIIVDAPLCRDIVAAARKAGVPQDSVIVTGRLPYYEYLEMLMSADAVLVSLRNHPFDICKSPGKLLYPMALEVPVIATKVGEAAYSLPRANCGILIPYDNPEKAASMIVEFMSLPSSERIKMGINGRKYLELQHNPKIIAKRLASLFEKALTEK